MIEIKLTDQEAIALEVFLANRVMHATGTVPIDVKRDLAEKDYSNKNLDYVHNKLHFALQAKLKQQPIQ